MIVYYGDLNNQLLVQPKPVVSLLKKVENGADFQLKRCPAFIDFYKNTYAVYPTFDYTLTFDASSGAFRSQDYSQEAFNSMIRPRVVEEGVFSLMSPYLCLVPEADTLMVEQLPLAFPFAVPKYSVIPGEFDTGKHTRPLELACKAEPNAEIVFERDEPIYLLKFKTDEPIDWRPFRVTERFTELLDAVGNMRDMVKKRKPLSFYYGLSREHKLKKQFLALAKQNAIG